MGPNRNPQGSTSGLRATLLYICTGWIPYLARYPISPCKVFLSTWKCQLNDIHCLKSTHIDLIRELELSLKFLKTFRRNGKCWDSVPGEIGYSTSTAYRSRSLAILATCTIFTRPFSYISAEQIPQILCWSTSKWNLHHLYFHSTLIDRFSCTVARIAAWQEQLCHCFIKLKHIFKKKTIEEHYSVILNW